MSVQRPFKRLWDGFDYFSDKYKRKLQEYTIRFRYAFPDKDEFVAQFPEEVRPIADEYYPILFNAFGNLLLRWNTGDQCRAMLYLISRNKMQLFVRSNEFKGLRLEDFFNNDVIQTLESQNKQNDTTSDKSSTKGSNTSNTANNDFQNEYLGDKDAPIDDSKWKAEKYLNSGSVDTTQNNTEGNSSSERKTDGTSSTKLEKKDIQYKMGDIMKLFAMAKDPNTTYFYSILRSMMAPITLDYETYIDWRGDFE